VYASSSSEDAYYLSPRIDNDISRSHPSSSQTSTPQLDTVQVLEQLSERAVSR
jgi:hypothetical protein